MRLLFQEIFQDRKKFAETVFKVAAADLINMGISVVSYTLKDISDDQVHSTNMSGTQLMTSDSLELFVCLGKGTHGSSEMRRAHRRGRGFQRCTDKGTNIFITGSEY